MARVCLRCGHEESEAPGHGIGWCDRMVDGTGLVCCDGECSYSGAPSRADLGPLLQLPPLFTEALAVHDIMQTFGVPAACIYVSYSPAGELLVIAKDDRRSASVRIGQVIGLREEDFRVEWDRAVDLYNASPRSDRCALLESSHARDQALAIIAGLVGRGFVPTGSRS